MKQKFWVQNELACIYCKAISKKDLRILEGLFRPIISDKYLSICWFFTCNCLKTDPEIQKNAFFRK